MRAVNAWLLDLGGGLHAAVGELEMIHVLPDPPTLFEIPQTPDYCRRVLVWQGEVLPLLDLAERLSAGTVGRAGPLAGARDLVAIVAFQRHPGDQPRHGGLLLRGMPVRIAVTDADACELPESLQAWRPCAASCFSNSTVGAVPVVDLHRVFSQSSVEMPASLPSISGAFQTKGERR